MVHDPSSPHGLYCATYQYDKIIACDTPSHDNDNLCQIGNPSRTVHAVEPIWQYVPYLSSFIAKSWPNDPEDISQGQRSLHVTHPLMVMIICAKYGNNPSRTVSGVEQTLQDMTYFSSFFAKSWLNDLEDIGQGQRSLCMPHPLMVVISAHYGKNPSRTVDVTERTQQMGRTYFNSFVAKSCLNDLEDIDQGQRSYFVTHPLMVVIICAKYGKNPSRTVDVTERTRHAGRKDGERNRWSETNIPPTPPQQLWCAEGVISLKLCSAYVIETWGQRDHLIKKHGDIGIFLGSFLSFCHYWSQICGDMGPYNQTNWGHSWFYCAHSPHFPAST